MQHGAAQLLDAPAGDAVVGGRNHFAIRCKSNTQVAEIKGSEEDFDILDASAKTRYLEYVYVDDILI